MRIHSSNPTIDPQFNHHVEPVKHSLLQRIMQVGKNTIFEMVKHLPPTIAAFSAIPMAIASGQMILIALPVIWVAYCVFDGVKLLKNQDRIPQYEQALEVLKQVRIDFEKASLEEIINRSTTLDELGKNLKIAQDKIKGFQAVIKNHGIEKFAFCDVFDSRAEWFLDLKTTEDKLSTQKDFIIDMYIKNIKKHFDEQVKHLPGYIQLLKDNFYHRPGIY